MAAALNPDLQKFSCEIADTQAQELPDFFLFVVYHITPCKIVLFSTIYLIKKHVYFLYKWSLGRHQLHMHFLTWLEISRAEQDIFKEFIQISTESHPMRINGKNNC
jgi:hypothetical protein